MALTDVNFQEGEKQDFIIELPSASYNGNLEDITVEPSSTQFLLLEVPETGGSNIFIMSE